MSVTHQLISLSDVEATVVTIPGVESGTSLSLSIQNVDTLAVVYIGDSTVDSAGYGAALSPGEVISFDNLAPASEVYAISDTNSSKVAVMRVRR